MGFDKVKAMRNAERSVAQGKIRAAIAEYKSVVENDPRDIATMNMLGDLYAKNSEKIEAVNCYLKVAEHYNAQGFAQKAIAVYNKISRIQPDSIEVSVKLAELHKVKGSLAEARSHYSKLAEHYQVQGKRLEALAMYKQIALLDPNNTEVSLNLADSYIREGQRDEAVEAYAEAGARFSRQNRHEEAIQALMKGYDIKSGDLRILNGLVKAQTALGRAAKAASLLESILEDEPYNRDVLYLLIECCLDSSNAAGAEKAVIKLVEIEPANYPKFLDLIRIYLNANDPESAARILTMSSEYLLAGGQADECGQWINEILERDPSQLSGLRLLVRYSSWLKDENGFRLSLERLYKSAATSGSVDDERYALSNLVIIRPHETRYRDRLLEINAEFGYDDDDLGAELVTAQFASDEEPHLDDEHVEAVDGDQDGSQAEIDDAFPALSLADEQKVQKELESIAFYMENDYNELADKALAELVKEYGERPEFSRLKNGNAPEPAQKAAGTGEVSNSKVVMGSAIGIDEIRSEFGIESGEDTGGDASGDNDYDTRYQMGVAYLEMGLLEEAILEFQAAVKLAEPGDGTRRLFYCSNLLGHAFLQKGMAKQAISWINRALETKDISSEEHHGLWYELGLAHESDGDPEGASRYFEMIYSENVDFRDVRARVNEAVVKL